MDDRNDTAHANGNIFYSTKESLDAKIADILRVVDEIQGYSRPLIERCYREFLLRSHNPDEREFLDDADQIREMLIHEHYLPQKDIEICLRFDFPGMVDETGTKHMRALHDVLVTTYQDQNPD